MQAAIRRIEDIVLKTDKTLCTLVSGFEQAKVLFEKGYKMVTLMADGIALARAAHDQVTEFRGLSRSRGFPPGRRLRRLRPHLYADPSGTRQPQRVLQRSGSPGNSPGWVDGYRREAKIPFARSS